MSDGAQAAQDAMSDKAVVRRCDKAPPHRTTDIFAVGGEVLPCCSLQALPVVKEQGHLSLLGHYDFYYELTCSAAEEHNSVCIETCVSCSGGEIVHRLLLDVHDKTALSAAVGPRPGAVQECAVLDGGVVTETNGTVKARKYYVLQEKLLNANNKRRKGPDHCLQLQNGPTLLFLPRRKGGTGNEELRDTAVGWLQRHCQEGLIPEQLQNDMIAEMKKSFEKKKKKKAGVKRQREAEEPRAGKRRKTSDTCGERALSTAPLTSLVQVGPRTVGAPNITQCTTQHSVEMEEVWKSKGFREVVEHSLRACGFVTDFWYCPSFPARKVKVEFIAPDMGSPPRIGVFRMSLLYQLSEMEFQEVCERTSYLQYKTLRDAVQRSTLPGCEYHTEFNKCIPGLCVTCPDSGAAESAEPKGHELPSLKVLSTTMSCELLDETHSDQFFQAQRSAGGAPRNAMIVLIDRSLGDEAFLKILHSGNVYVPNASGESLCTINPSNAQGANEKSELDREASESSLTLLVIRCLVGFSVDIAFIPTDVGDASAVNGSCLQALRLAQRNAARKLFVLVGLDFIQMTSAKHWALRLLEQRQNVEVLCPCPNEVPLPVAIGRQEYRSRMLHVAFKAAVKALSLGPREHPALNCYMGVDGCDTVESEQAFNATAVKELTVVRDDESFWYEHGFSGARLAHLAALDESDLLYMLDKDREVTRQVWALLNSKFGRVDISRHG